MFSSFLKQKLKGKNIFNLLLWWPQSFFRFLFQCIFDAQTEDNFWRRCRSYRLVENSHFIADVQLRCKFSRIRNSLHAWSNFHQHQKMEKYKLIETVCGSQWCSASQMNVYCLLLHCKHWAFCNGTTLKDIGCPWRLRYFQCHCSFIFAFRFQHTLDITRTRENIAKHTLLHLDRPWL